jgi:hypothetical protein
LTAKKTNNGDKPFKTQQKRVQSTRLPDKVSSSQQKSHAEAGDFDHLQQVYCMKKPEKLPIIVLKKTIILFRNNPGKTAASMQQ